MGFFLTFLMFMVPFLVISSVHSSTIARFDRKDLPINHLLEWSIVDQPPLPFFFGSNSSQGRRSLENDSFLQPDASLSIFQRTLVNHSLIVEENRYEYARFVSEIWEKNLGACVGDTEYSLAPETLSFRNFYGLMVIVFTISLISIFAGIIIRSLSWTANDIPSFSNRFSTSFEGEEVNRIQNLELGIRETSDKVEASSTTSTSSVQSQLVSIEIPIVECSQITTPLSPSHELENRQNQIPSAPGMIAYQNEISVNDEPLKWGKTNISLTFQATLALMLFFQSTQPSSSSSTFSSPPSSEPSMSINLIGASMVFGFTFSLISILLRNVCQRASIIGDYIGLLSTTFGFFMMIEVFLPKSLGWTIWPAFSFIFIAFVFVLAKSKLIYS